MERLTIIPPPGVADPVLVEQQKMAASAHDAEQTTVAATRVAIEKCRKSGVTLRVVDTLGRPVANAKVSVEQTGHEFLFGCNIFCFDRYSSPDQNAIYKKRFEDLFNYATLPFYWRGYEQERGKPDYQRTDKVVEWCQQRGVRMKGHPLLWGDQPGVPPWSNGQPSPAIQRQRVRDIMSRYRGRIAFWEVVNEPSHIPQLTIDDPYRWARQTDAQACLIVNDYHILADGCPAFLKLLTDAKADGVPFDGIGIQAHEPRTMRFPLDQVRQILDQYASLGKELHITEFTPTSGGEQIIGAHRQRLWDEEAQADYAVKFYRVCFAHPAVRGITWWDLCDQHSWLKGGGMLRTDLSPKPVYEQLKRLIHEEWDTRLVATTDMDGRLSFRGFRGKYRLLIETAGGMAAQQFDLTKDGPAEMLVTVPPPGAASVSP